MKYRYIYRIKCLVGEYKDYYYIGQHTTSKLDDGYAGLGAKIIEYYCKYGEIEGTTYKKDILRYAESQPQLDNYEKYYIRQYKNTYGPKCLNIADGPVEHEFTKESHIYIKSDKCVTTEELVAKLGLINKNKTHDELFNWFVPHDANYVLTKLNLDI